MVDFEKLLKKIQTMPWRLIIGLLAVSFVVATLTSNTVSILLMPDLSGSLGKGGTDFDVGDGGVPLAKQTLSEADLKIIYDRNIFNRDGQLGDLDASGDEAAPTAEAQKSDLPLKLLGIIYGGTPFNGLATIENTQNNKINSFVVGDILVKDATVVEIHRSRVFLQRGKRKEYLELEQKEIVRSSRQKKAAPTAGSSSTAIATGPALTKYKEEGFEREGTDMVMSQEYKQRMILGDMTKVLQDAKAVPNMVDNQIRGFRLERIREGSIYQKAGFQNGDIVEEINGTILTDPGNAIKLLQQLRNESEIEVVVNRNGAPMKMKLNVR